MTMTPSIYLAGSVQHSDNGGATWRENIEADYGDEFEFLNPLDNHDLGGGDAVWRQPGQRVADLPDEADVVETEEILGGDKKLIRQSNAVLIAIQETITAQDGTTYPVPTYGTPREHEYAACALGLPVVVWYDGTIDMSPWAMGDTAFMSTDIESCLDYIEAEYSQRQTRAEMEGVLE